MKKFLLSLAAVALVSGFASAKTVYWDNSETDWANVYAHSWNPATTWPGEKVTETVEIDGKTYYAATIEDAKTNVIFDNGTGAQTEDLPAVDFQNGYAYNLDGTSVEVGQGGGDDPDPDVVPLYIVGSVSNWTSSAAYKMTADGNGNYTIHLDKLSGDFKITTDIVAGKWNDEYTYTSGEAMALGQEYTCTAGGSANMSVEGLGATDVTVDFNINTLVIKVTGTAITEAVVKYFLKGNFESELWPSTELVENNGLYSASIRPATAECSFIVYKTVDGVESGWYKGVEAIPGQTVTMLNDQGGDATVTLNIGSTYLFAFEPETLALTVTMTSGVADIEAAEDVPAVYYNLQGVRVANPANGLFLEVRGNQVRKVAVK